MASERAALVVGRGRRQMLPEARKAAGLLSTWYKLAALEVRTCRQVMPLHPYTPGGRFEASGRLEYFFPLSPTGGPRGPRGGYGGQGRMPLHPYTPGGRFEALGRLEYFFPLSPTGGAGGPRGGYGGQGRMPLHPYTPGARFEALGRLEYFFSLPFLLRAMAYVQAYFFSSSTPIKKREHKGVRV